MPTGDPDPLALLDRAYTLVFVLCSAGFPVAVTLAWMFELARASFVALVGVLGIGAGILLAGRLGATRATDSTTLAVMPFTVRGSPEIAYLAEGMVDLLSGSMGGPGALRSIPPEVVLGEARLRMEDDGSLSAAKSGEVARALGTRLYVDGSVVQVGGSRIRVTAHLHDESGDPALQPIVREARERLAALER